MDALKEESMRRMRWRLWFVFAESKYEVFSENGKGLKPHFDNIKAYSLKHWGKEIKDMTEKELSKNIAIISKWK